MLKWLIEHNCLKLNQKLQGRESYPIHHVLDRPDVVELFIKNGANVNVKGDWGSTPLHDVHKDLRVVELLLNNGANINARDNLGRTPLKTAKDEKIRAFLIAHGAIE